MTEPGAPHNPPQGGADHPEGEPRRSSWTGFPTGPREPDTAPEVSSAPAEESSPGTFSVEPPRYRPDPDTEPTVTAADPESASSTPRPEFRSVDRHSRRLEEERRLDEARRPLNYFTRRTGILDVLIAFLFIAVGYFSVILTYRGFGHSWDEALYLKGAVRAAEWVRGVFQKNTSLLTPGEIENAWGSKFEDPLHPEVGPAPKLVIGFGSLLLPEKGVPPINAGRIPVAAVFGLTLALVYLMGTAEYGRIGGFSAAFAYLLLPRVFGHAHIAASETLLAFAVALTVWSYLAGIARWPLAIFLTAPAFALALGTKVNAFFLPIPLIIWGQLYRRRDYGSNIFAMLILAPVLLVAIWPWLWHDAPRKLLAFLDFYASHQSTSVWYMGQKWGYGRPAAPWHYPFIITLAVVPAWIAFLAAVGIIRAGFQFLSRPVPILFLMLMFTFLGISALPASPKYDGERLFFPAFLFLALLAGGGFSGLAAAAREAALGSHYRPGTDIQAIVRSQNFGAALFLLTFALGGAWIVYRSHPNQLNYFNQWFAEGTKGAEEYGFETSYWGEALNEEVTQWLTENIESGQKVKVLAMEGLVFQHLQEWGRLPEDINFAPESPPYDWYILQNRKGFFGNLERTLFSKQPFKVFEFDGVPRILVYTGDALPYEAAPPPPPPVSPDPASGTAPDTDTVTEPETASLSSENTVSTPEIDAELSTESLTEGDPSTLPAITAPEAVETSAP